MRHALLAMLLLATMSGCSGSPSEGVAKGAFEARLRKQLGNTSFNVDSFRKTNGQEVNLGGVSGYRLFYTSTVSFPQGYRPECVSDGSKFVGFNCWLGFAGQGGIRPQPVGASVNYSGEIDFQKTENGWVTDSVTMSAA
jgi:hypothetical protein